MTYDEAFEILVKDGTIYQPPYDAIFDFVDAVAARKSDVAFDLYEQCKEIGEATLVMLTVLYNKFKAILQIKCCHSSDISKSTGLTGWQINNSKQFVKNFTEEELVYILKMLAKCERNFKQGRIEEQFIMDYVLIKILGI